MNMGLSVCGLMSECWCRGMHLSVCESVTVWLCVSINLCVRACVCHIMSLWARVSVCMYVCACLCVCQRAVKGRAPLHQWGVVVVVRWRGLEGRQSRSSFHNHHPTSSLLLYVQGIGYINIPTSSSEFTISVCVCWESKGQLNIVVGEISLQVCMYSGSCNLISASQSASPSNMASLLTHKPLPNVCTSPSHTYLHILRLHRLVKTLISLTIFLNFYDTGRRLVDCVLGNRMPTRSLHTHNDFTLLRLVYAG